MLANVSLMCKMSFDLLRTSQLCRGSSIAIIKWLENNYPSHLGFMREMVNGALPHKLCSHKNPSRSRITIELHTTVMTNSFHLSPHTLRSHP